ncbi:MAG: hypothetical protein F6K41_03900 [Symploca sp. SIO3E6]|nr:hypothetical protein [Caldora sp. SIO3E6]
MTESSQKSSVHLSGLSLLAGELEDTVGDLRGGLTPHVVQLLNRQDFLRFVRYPLT